ncbi:hypothetical protein K439DRAFT_1635796 [Ramaria rubella]|nr:hypothetical protein K439DRAFT_1635796 [Ramaria rubella]
MRWMTLPHVSLCALISCGSPHIYPKLEISSSRPEFDRRLGPGAFDGCTSNDVNN